MKSWSQSEFCNAVARWAAVFLAAALLQACGACGKAPEGSGGSPDVPSDIGTPNSSPDGGVDARLDAGPPSDGGIDVSVDSAGWDTGSDALFDADLDAPADSGSDIGIDSGFDASADGGGDASLDGSADCKEPGDLEGVYLDRDWNAPVNLIEDDYEAALGDGYLSWLIPLDGYDGKGLKFLDLETKMVKQVPNCQGFQNFNELSIKGFSALWTNGYVFPSGHKGRVAYMSDLSKKETPRPVSMDENGSVYYPHFDGDNLVYNFLSRSPNVKTGNYHTVISTSVTKRLDVVDERILYPDMLFFDAHIFGKTVINNGGTESSTFDIDTLEVRWHPHNTGSRDLVGSYYQTKIAYQSWVDSAKYGHPSTDVFVFDVSDDSLVRLTEDERSQWIPKIYGNLVLWQELINEKAEEGYGYYVIYDLDTGVRRRIPGIENDGWVWGVTKTHAAIRGGASSVSAPLYLVDLEKADVVKDGHVVPEVKDGGTSGQ